MRSSPRTTSTLVRLGGTAAVLAGLCYGAAGYLDRPSISGYTGALVFVLSVAIPALFLGGAVGPSRPTTGRYTNGLRELSGNRRVLVGRLRSRAGYSRCVGIGRNGDNVFLVGAVVGRLDVDGPGRILERRATAFGSRGVDLGRSGLGLLAYRSRLLQRFGAHAPGPRRFRGRVLPEFRGVGGGTDGVT